MDAARRAIAMVDDLPDDVQRARASCAYAYSAQYIEQMRETTSAILVDARRYAERGDAAHTLAMVTHLQGDVLMRALRFAEGHATYEDAMRRYRALGDGRGVAMVLANMAEGQFVRGEVAEALRNAREVLAMMQALNERTYSLIVMANVAMYALAAGDVTTAQAHCDEGLQAARDTERPMELAIYVGIAAMLASAQGEHPRSALLLGLTDRLYRDGRFLRDGTETRLYEQLVARLAEHLGADELARLRTLGEQLSLEQAPFTPGGARAPGPRR
jgi:ATP/maltotriose-dependent transcriptional regulator MalT